MSISFKTKPEKIQAILDACSSGDFDAIKTIFDADLSFVELHEIELALILICAKEIAELKRLEKA